MALYFVVFIDGSRNQFKLLNPLSSTLNQLRKLREIEFEKARANGTVIDVDTKQDMQNAKKIKGTCTEMCPAYEREEREAKFNLKKEELVSLRHPCGRVLPLTSEPAARRNGQPSRP